MFTKNVLIVSVIAVLSTNILCYGYSDCESKNGEVIDVNIPGCNNNRTCILKRNTNVTLEITFKAKEDSDTLTAEVYGIILNIPMPFPLDNPDACKDSGITCPIKAGQTYKYVSNLKVLAEYPRVTVTVKWELKTGDNNDAVCILVPAKIK